MLNMTKDDKQPKKLSEEEQQAEHRKLLADYSHPAIASYQMIQVLAEIRDELISLRKALIEKTE